jgi:hypothetical protein
MRELLREPAHRELTLAAFLHQTEVDLTAIYRPQWSWTLFRQDVGIDARVLAEGEAEALKQLHKLLHVADERRLGAWTNFARLVQPTSEVDRRLMGMLFAVLYGVDEGARETAWATWSRHEVLREELEALVGVLRSRNGLLPHPHVLEAAVPLVLHGRYLGAELSAAFDQRTAGGAFRNYYTGVEATPGGRYDMLFVTLEKDEGAKEHLRYRDFPVNERAFQWQSQAGTLRSSRLGRRHLDPRSEGCTPLLFVRERSDDRPNVTMAFQYLGPVAPRDPRGERPITIEWELDYAMPLELLRVGRIAA